MAVVDVEVETDEEDDGDEEGNEGEEDELLEEARLLEVNSELVLLLRQFVSVALEQGVSNVFHILSFTLLH